MSKQKIIRYAGYDPQENRFPPRVVNLARRQIDVAKALELRAKGLRWREVGVLLASERRRRTPFCPQSIVQAIRHARQQ